MEEDLYHFAVKCLSIFVCTVIRNAGCRMSLGVINDTRVFGDAVVILILVITFPFDSAYGRNFQHKDKHFFLSLCLVHLMLYTVHTHKF